MQFAQAQCRKCLGKNASEESYDMPKILDPEIELTIPLRIKAKRQLALLMLRLNMIRRSVIK